MKGYGCSSGSPSCCLIYAPGTRLLANPGFLLPVKDPPSFIWPIKTSAMSSFPLGALSVEFLASLNEFLVKRLLSADGEASAPGPRTESNLMPN